MKSGLPINTCKSILNLTGSLDRALFLSTLVRGSPCVILAFRVSGRDPTLTLHTRFSGYCEKVGRYSLTE